MPLEEVTKEKMNVFLESGGMLEFILEQGQVLEIKKSFRQMEKPGLFDSLFLNKLDHSWNNCGLILEVRSQLKQLQCSVTNCASV